MFDLKGDNKKQTTMNDMIQNLEASVTWLKERVNVR